MIDPALSRRVLAAGLIQFGYFEPSLTTNSPLGTGAPVRSLFGLIVSYPDLLADCARALWALASAHGTYQRLLCPADSVALGTAITLYSGVPLVYSRGRGEDAVFDLVGAYDIGHPALLIAHTIDLDAVTLIAKARRVGLEIGTCATLLDTGRVHMPDGIVSHALFPMAAWADYLEAEGDLPRGQADAIRASIANRDE